jgi:two-component system, chemotaxis family, chemotaxis protein CheY
MRVLIIDDSIVMRKIIENALRNSGIKIGEVLHAANGVEGLAALEKIAAQSQSLNLILCDVHMPVMDGLGFLLERPKRHLAPGVPVIMITADESDPYLILAIAAGAQCHISKPFTLEQIQTSIVPLLRHAIAAAQPNQPANTATRPTTGGAP